MLDFIKKLFDNRSRMEKAIDGEVVRSSLKNEHDSLNRRVIPALMTMRIDKPDARLSHLRFGTACLEHRIKENHPELAADMEMYDWTGASDGPTSPQFTADICAMATTEWERKAPLDVKKNWTFGGDLRPNFYAIDTTPEYVEAWFQMSSLERDPIDTILKDFLAEYEQKGSFTLPVQCLQEEATNIRQEFQHASGMY